MCDMRDVRDNVTYVTYLDINRLVRFAPLAVHLHLHHLRRSHHQLEALAPHVLDEHRQVQQPAPVDLHRPIPFTTNTHEYPPSSIVTHHYTPRHASAAARARRPAPSHTVTHRYPPLPTVTHRHPPSPTVNHRHPPPPTDACSSGSCNTCNVCNVRRRCFHIARCFHAKTDYASALQWYSQSAKEAPAYTAPQFGLGQMHLVNSDTQKAIDAFERVLKHSPENVDALKVNVACGNRRL